MKVTPASTKIRRWFVAGVAAVMAIAWTVSSLVTPGTADVTSVTVKKQTKITEAGQFQWHIPPRVINTKNVQTTQAQRFYDGGDLPPAGQPIGTRYTFVDGVTRVLQEAPFKTSSKQGGAAGIDTTKRIWVPEGWQSKPPQGTWPSAIADEDIVFTSTGSAARGVELSNYRVIKKGLLGIGADDYYTWIVQPYTMATSNGQGAFCIEPSVHGTSGVWTSMPGFPQNITTSASVKQNKGTIQKIVGLWKSGRISQTVAQAAIWRLVWGKAWNFHWETKLFGGSVATPEQVNAAIALAEQEVGKKKQDLEQQLKGLKIVSTKPSETKDGNTKFFLKLEGFDDLTLVKPGQKQLIKVKVKLNDKIIGISAPANQHTGEIWAADAAKGFTVTVKGTEPVGDDCRISASVDAEVVAKNIKVDAVFVKVDGGQSQVVADGTVSFSHTFHAEKDTTGCQDRTGAFKIAKAVTGTSNPAKTFAFNVNCRKGQQQLPVETINVKAGQTVTSKQYPLGTVCTVNENEESTAINGVNFTGVSFSGGEGNNSNQVTINSANSANATITATNNYEKPKPKEGQFTIRKAVSGVANGTVVNNSFKFTLRCDGLAPEQFELQNGGSKVVGPLPAGTKCTLNEAADADISIPGYKFDRVTYRGGNVPGHDNQITVTEGMNATHTFTATNNYLKPKMGHFKIMKGYEETSSYKDPDREYHVKVICSKDGESVGSEYLTISENKAAVTRDYELGTVCTVQEDIADANTVPGHRLIGVRYPAGDGVGFQGTGFNRAAIVKIQSQNKVVEVDVCNEYQKDTGSFKVRKAVEGLATTPANSYSFTATCDDDTTETNVVKAGQAVSFNSHPDGTICTITENESSAQVSGHTLSNVAYSGGNVEGEANKVRIEAGVTQALTLTATNTYTRDNGILKIHKVVQGAPASSSNTYTFTANCKDGDNVLEPKTVTARGGQTVSFGTFPVGAVCTISESTAGTAIANHDYKGVTFSGGNNSEHPEQVTITKEPQGVTVTATNTYEKQQGTFTIVKSFGADSSFKGDDSKGYAFKVTCGNKTIDNVKVYKDSDWTWASPSLPVGTQCTVSEDLSVNKVKGHSFQGVTLSSTAGTVSNNKATFTIAKGNNAITVEAVNTYAQPTLKTDASSKDGNKLVKGKAAQLKDKVTFTSLEKGKTYTVGGYFIDKATGEAVTKFYTKKFTTDQLQGKVENNGLVSGYLELTDPAWTVTPNSNAGQSFVAFEYLWEGEQPTTPSVPERPGTDKVTPKPDVEHENPDDPNQTVSSEEKGSFTIEKKLAGNAAGKVAKDAVFPFTVDCGSMRIENVTVGKKFTSADLPVGTECRVTENDAPAHFTGATLKKVAFTLNAQPVQGDTATFTIKKGDTPKIALVATNTYDTPTVTTDAKPEAPALEAKSVKVVDKVSYTNLIAGKEYTVQGQLRYQNGDAPSATEGGIVTGIQPGKGCTVDGSAVDGKDCTVGNTADSVAYTFIAPGTKGELVSGYVDLVFNVPATAVQSKPMVVFEDVYYDGKKVVGHHDINDNKQTVPVKEKVQFAIKKLLAGDGASQANGIYHFTATCAGKGETGTPQNLTVNVTDGEAAVSAEQVVAYVGQTCTITEQAPANNPALTSKVSFNAGDIAGAKGGQTLTVPVTKANKDQLNATDFAFEATNTVTVKKASFSVTKESATATGNVAIPRTFTFAYDCGGDNKGTLTVAKGETKAGPELPIGTQCTVKETGANVAKADLVTSWKVNDRPVAPQENGTVAFTIGEANSVVKIAANNAYTEHTGSFSLAKKLSTSVTTQKLKGTNFKFTYTCKDGDAVVARSVTPVDVVANGKAVTINKVPFGATCTVEEVELPSAPNATHALSWTVKDVTKTGAKAEFTIDSKTVPVSVVAHNTYTDKKPGFQVIKAVSGDAKVKPAEFTFDYVCGEAKGSFKVSESASFQSAHDAALKDLKVGTQCTLTERAPQGLTQAKWKGVTFERSGNIADSSWSTDTKAHSATFTVPAGDSALVINATNTFDQERGKIAVKKVVDAAGVSGVPTGFTFALSCVDGATPVEVADATKTIKAGETAMWDNLPAGLNCTIKELKTTTPANATHELKWNVNGDAVEASSVTATVGANTTVNVEAVNKYSNNPASFTIQKKSAVMTGKFLKDDEKPTIPGEFTFSYKCGDAAEWTTLKPVKAGAEPVKVDGLVAGKQCQVREEADAHAGTRIVIWKVNGVEQPSGDVISFTPGAGDSIAVVVDNEYPTKPQIKTTLTDSAGNKDIDTTVKSDKAGEEPVVVLKDVVNYVNLDVSKTYELSGTLKAWDKDGNVIDTNITGKSEAFKPETPNGSKIVNFTIPASKLDEFAKVVAYEKLTINGEVVAKHENPDDPTQIVVAKPKIGTTLTTEDGKGKSYNRPTSPEGTTKLVDRVVYTNLVVGKTYRITGQLHGDNELTDVKAWSDKFTVEAPAENPNAKFVSGYKDITFYVPNSVLQANSKLVAYEKLWDEGKLVPPSTPVNPEKPVTPENPDNPTPPGDKVTPPTPKDPSTPPDATHEDPNDPNQTVKRNPSVATSAEVIAKGEDAHVKTIDLEKQESKEVQIVDHMQYHNFVTGDYVAMARLVNADGGTIGEGSQAFSVTTAHGNVNVPMNVTVTKDDVGKNLKAIVYEKIYRKADVVNGKVVDDAKPVATHEDAEDNNQTIHVTVENPPLPPAPKLIVQKKVNQPSGEETLPADTLYGFEVACEGSDNPVRFVLEANESKSDEWGDLDITKACTVTEVGPVEGLAADGQWKKLTKVGDFTWKSVSWTRPVEEGEVAEATTGTSYKFNAAVPGNGVNSDVTIIATNDFTKPEKPTPPANKLIVEKKVVAPEGEKTLPADTLYGFEVACEGSDNPVRFVLEANQSKSDEWGDLDITKACTVTEVGPVEGLAADGQWKKLTKVGDFTWKGVAWTKNGEAATEGDMAGDHGFKVSVPAAGSEGATDVKVVATNSFNDEIPPTPPKPEPHKLIVTKKVDTSAVPGSIAFDTKTLFGFELTCEGTEKPLRFVLKADESKSSDWGDLDITKPCVLKEVGAVTKLADDGANWDTVSVDSFEWKGVSWKLNNTDATEKQKVDKNGVKVSVPVAGTEDGKDLTVVATNAYTVPDKTPSVKTTAKDMRQDNPDEKTHEDREVLAGSDAAIEDVVELTNLKSGQEYKIVGQLMNKNKEERVPGVTATNINECGFTVKGGTFTPAKCESHEDGTVSLTFTAGAKADASEATSYVDGTAIMQFRVPAKQVARDSVFVVFENLFEIEQGKETQVGEHRDYNDERQTVKTGDCPDIPPSNPPTTPDLPDKPKFPPDEPTNPEVPGAPKDCPRIGTTLVDPEHPDDKTIDKDGKVKEYSIVSGKEHKLIDRIGYTDLRPGETYTFLGRLHKNDDVSQAGVLNTVKPGTKCSADGAKVDCKAKKGGFVEVTFTTRTDRLNAKGYVDGFVNMEFVIPKQALTNMKKVVAFETAYNSDGYMVAWHHDISSPSQTKKIEPPKPPSTPPTGTTIIPPTFLAKTGATAFTLLALGVMALIGGGALVWASRQRKEQ